MFFFFFFFSVDHGFCSCSVYSGFCSCAVDQSFCCNLDPSLDGIEYGLGRLLKCYPVSAGQ